MSSPNYGRRHGDRKVESPSRRASVDAPELDDQLTSSFAAPTPFTDAGHQLLATGFLLARGDRLVVDLQVILVNQGVAPLRDVSLTLLSFTDAALRPLSLDAELTVNYGDAARLEPGRTLRWQAEYTVDERARAAGGELVASLRLRADSDLGETHDQQLDAMVPLD